MTNDHKNRQPADVEANADRTEKDAVRCKAGNNAREVFLVPGALIVILMLLTSSCQPGMCFAVGVRFLPSLIWREMISIGTFGWCATAVYALSAQARLSFGTGPVQIADACSGAARRRRMIMWSLSIASPASGTDILGEGEQTGEKLRPHTVAYAVDKYLNNSGKWRQP